MLVTASSRVCVVSCVAYGVVGISGCYFLLRFRRLRCVRRVRPWYSILHYACYGLFLAYVAGTAPAPAPSTPGTRTDDALSSSASAASPLSSSPAPSAHGADAVASLPPPTAWQAGADLARRVAHAFAAPWTPGAPPTATSTVPTTTSSPPWRAAVAVVLEPVLEATAATALLSSYALLCHARWRYGVMRTAERQPGLWWVIIAAGGGGVNGTGMRQSGGGGGGAAAAGAGTGLTVAAVAGDGDGGDDDLTAVVVPGTSGAAATAAEIITSPSVFTHRPHRRHHHHHHRHHHHRARPLSRESSSSSRSSSSSSSSSSSIVSGSNAAGSPLSDLASNGTGPGAVKSSTTARPASGHAGASAALRPRTVRRHRGGHLPRVAFVIHDGDGDSSDDDEDEEVAHGEDAPDSEESAEVDAAGGAVLGHGTYAADVEEGSAGFAARLRRLPRRLLNRLTRSPRPRPHHEAPTSHGRRAWRQPQEPQHPRRRVQLLRQRLLAAFWTRDVAVVVQTGSVFAGLALARVAVAVAVHSVWSASAQPTASAPLAAALPRPTIGFVGLASLALLGLEQTLLRQWTTLPAQLIAAVAALPAPVTVSSGDTMSGRTAATATTAAATAAAVAATHYRQQRRGGARQHHLKHGGTGSGVGVGRQHPTSVVDASVSTSMTSWSLSSGVSGGGGTAAGAGAVGASPHAFQAAAARAAVALPAPYPARPLLAVVVSLLSLQVVRTPSAAPAASAPAWAVTSSRVVVAAVPLVVSGCAAVSFVVALREPVWWVSTEYRRLTNRTWWQLFFSPTFTPFSLDLLNAHGQQLMRSTAEEEGLFGVGHAVSRQLSLGAVSPGSPLGVSHVLRGSHPRARGGGGGLVPLLDTNGSTTNTTTAAAAAAAVDGPFDSLRLGQRVASSVTGSSASAALPRAPTSITSAGTAAARLGEGIAGADSAAGADGLAGDVTPMQFWHGVAAKVLQDAGRVTGEVAVAAVDAGDNATSGSATAATDAAATQGAVTFSGGGLHRSFAGLRGGDGPVTAATLELHTAEETDTGGVTNASFLGVTDPFGGHTAAAAVEAAASAAAAAATQLSANPLAMLEPVAGMEHLNTASAKFNREKLKGSMLLSLPTVARVGGEAAAQAQADAATQQMQDRLLAMQRSEQQQDEVAARTRRLSHSAELGAEAGTSRSADAADGDDAVEQLMSFRSAQGSTTRSNSSSLDTRGRDRAPREAPTQSSTSSKSDGWVSRALATVVPRLATAARRGSNESGGGTDGGGGGGGGGGSGTGTGPGDSLIASSGALASEEASPSFVGSFSSAHSLAARALISDEEGFQRFLDCVRRDGDNTYALQNLLAVHGHTYGQRVDAKGRTALHYAVMGGFVHGAVFLTRIGAEPNVLDKAGYAPLHYAVLYHTEFLLSPSISDESPSAAVQGARHVLGIPVVATSSVQAAAQAKRRRRRHQQAERSRVEAQLQAMYSVVSDEAIAVGSARTPLGDDILAPANRVAVTAAAAAAAPTSSSAHQSSSYATTTTTTTTTTGEPTPHDSAPAARSVSETGSGALPMPRSPPPRPTMVPPHSPALRELAPAASTPIAAAVAPAMTTNTTTTTATTTTTSSTRTTGEQAVRGSADATATTTTTTNTTTAAAAAAAAAVAAVAAVTAAAVVPEEKGQWYGMVSALVRRGALVDLPTAKGLTALHLAVMQGSIGLINTLLREGANPLLGSEPETLSLASAVRTASWSDDEDNNHSQNHNGEAGENAMDGDDDLKAKTRALRATQQQQQEQRWRRRRRQCGSDGGTVTGSSGSVGHTAAANAARPRPTATATAGTTAHGDQGGSRDAAPAAAAVPARGRLDCGSFTAAAQQRCEWVDVHVTNAGRPIANGHCKSPLLLAVELDADLAVASMLHHAAVQATTARVVAVATTAVAAAAAAAAASASASAGANGSEGPSRISVSTSTDGGGGGTATATASSLVAAAQTANDSATSRSHAFPPLAPTAPPLPANAPVSGPSPKTSVGGVGVLGELSFSGAPLVRVSPASLANSLANPLADAGEDGAPPLPTASTEASAAAAAAGVSASATLSPVRVLVNGSFTSAAEAAGAAAAGPAPARSQLVSPLVTSATEPSGAGGSLCTTTTTTTTTAMTSFATSGSAPETMTTGAWTSTRWERGCLHGLNPVHIALLLGNAQVARVLLLRWRYTENETTTTTTTTHEHDHTATAGAATDREDVQAAQVSGAAVGHHADAKAGLARVPEHVPGADARGSATPGSTGTFTITTTTRALSDAGALTELAGELLGDDSVLTGAAAAAAVPSSPEATLAQITVPAAGGTAAELHAEEAVLGADALRLLSATPPPASCADPASLGKEAAPPPSRPPASQPTATLTLLPTSEASLLWVATLRLNLFHLAAVGDSTECLAYVLRWRGAPDYIPCALDDVFTDELRAEGARRDAAVATHDAYQRRRQSHRQQKRLRAFQGSHAAHSIAASVHHGQPSPSAPSASMTLAAAAATATTTSIVVVPSAEPLSTPPTLDAGVDGGLGEDAFPAGPSSTSASSVPNVSAASGAGAPPTVTTTTTAAAGAPPCTSPAPSSTGSSSAAAEALPRLRYGDGIGAAAAASSSATSDAFNHTWSSDPRSGASGAGSAVADSTGTRRTRRMRAKQQTFVRALVTLLQTNLRGEAARRRVRTTVFGAGTDPSGGGGGGSSSAAVARGVRRSTAGRAARSLGESDKDDTAYGGHSAMTARTCYGSTAAAAALHSGMAVCYATMGYPVRRRLRRGSHSGGADPHGDGDGETASATSELSDRSSRSSSQSCFDTAARETKTHRSNRGDDRTSSAAAAATGEEDGDAHGNDGALASRAYVLRQREEERLARLRQQRTRAFISAVAKLRQSLPGVPIDLAHLGALEWAVDRACARMTAATARRALQQALLIVTRRLQHQHRRARLASGLSRMAAAAAASARSSARDVEAEASDGDGGDAASTTTASSTSRARSGSSSSSSSSSSITCTSASARAPSSAVPHKTDDVTHATDEAHDEDGSGGSSPSSPPPEQRRTTLPATADLAHRPAHHHHRHRSRRHRGGGGGGGHASPALRHRRSSLTSAPSYYSSPYSILNSTHASTGPPTVGARSPLVGLHMPAPASSVAAAADNVDDARRRTQQQQQQQQRTLQLLGRLSDELNAVDTRGLTPLHYAVANQNASMVYLLCAYGAVFVFASEQTEAHLMAHPAEVVAAAAASAASAERHGGSASGGGGGRVVNFVRTPAAPTLRHGDAASSSTATLTDPLSPASTTGAVAAAAATPPAMASILQIPTAHRNNNGSGSGGSAPAPPASIFSPSTHMSAMRAQLAAPAITVATNDLAALSEQYYAQLTPTTQESLRRAAKAGSAEYLLLWMPTQEEREAERQRRPAAAAAAADGATSHAHGAVAAAKHPSPRPHSSSEAVVGMADTGSTGSQGSTAAPPLPRHPPPRTSAFTTSVAFAAPDGGSEEALASRAPPTPPPPPPPHAAQPTTMAATLTAALGITPNGSFLSVTSATPPNTSFDPPPHSPASQVSAATAVDGVADTAAAQLHAHLMEEEAKALHAMGASRGVDGLVGNGSLDDTLRLRSRAGSESGRPPSVQPTPQPQPQSQGSGSHAAPLGGVDGGEVMSSPTAAPSAVETDGTVASAASEGGVPPHVAQGDALSNGSRAGFMPSTPLTPAAAAAATVTYTLLEPHDVFLTHVVRNPAKADSIVRAAMEGTALRYLFLASLVTGDSDSTAAAG